MKLTDRIYKFLLTKILKLELYLAIKAVGITEFEKILIERGWTKKDLVNRRIYIKKDCEFTITEITN